MVYQHVNKKTTLVSLATSHIAHQCNQLNHVTLPISMLRFKNTIFYKNSSKIKLGWGFAPTPPASGSWGLRPRPYWPSAAPPSDQKISPPHCEFLATRLVPFLVKTFFFGLHLNSGKQGVPFLVKTFFLLFT